MNKEEAETLHELMIVLAGSLNGRKVWAYAGISLYDTLESYLSS